MGVEILEEKNCFSAAAAETFFPLANELSSARKWQRQKKRKKTKMITCKITFPLTIDVKENHPEVDNVFVERI